MTDPPKPTPAAEERTQQLLALARAEFPDLTPAEEALFTGIAAAGRVDFRSGDKKIDDPAQADQWGADRTLRAEVLAWLCTEPQTRKCLTHRGIWVWGAKITGRLNLMDARFPFSLILAECALPEVLNLQDAEVDFLALTGSHIGQLSADRLRVKGSVNLDAGFTAAGQVRLLGAAIGEVLNCRGGRFAKRKNDKAALFADRIKVTGNVSLDKGFTAVGEVRLLGAAIGGQLKCGGGHFTRQKGDKAALGLDGIKVDGDVLLDTGFSATGVVRLLGAAIGGDLICDDGHFTRQEVGEAALSADGIKVAGRVSLGKGLTTSGVVRLVGASIEGQLSCRGGSFDGRGGDAINAQGATIKGDMFWGPSRGETQSDLTLVTGTVDLQRATVDGLLEWEINLPEKTTLNLRYARLGVLADELSSWPPQGQLGLDGCTYRRIDELKSGDVDDRIEWLRRQANPEGAKAYQPTIWQRLWPQWRRRETRLDDNYYPQSYTQLALAFRQAGLVHEAQQVLIEQYRHFRQSHRLGFTRFLWYYLAGPFTGFGYRLRWPLIVTLLMCALGWGVFDGAYKGAVMAPAQHWAYMDTAAAQDPVLTATHAGMETHLKADYPPFRPLLYSVDTFFPIINLHQEDFWLPNPNRRGRVVLKGLGWFVPVPGLWIRWYLTFHIAMGWIVVALLAASVTGLVRKE